jgi:phosphorylcholine metabolism protein LicD
MNNQVFSKTNGFGAYKNMAIELLTETIKILDEFSIDYCLISGTLLGYARHNDIIPWDDDIDLLVDNSIISKLPAIFDKYNSTITFINRKNFILKTCFKTKGIPIKRENYNEYLMNKQDIYKWPFIDLFVYTTDCTNDTMSFFEKQWDCKFFFPLQKTPFLNIDVFIPSDPSYFLKINYGNDYMTSYKSSNYNHKIEKQIENIVTVRRLQNNKYTITNISGKNTKGKNMHMKFL